MIRLQNRRHLGRGGEALLDRYWPPHWASGWLVRAKTATAAEPAGRTEARTDSDAPSHTVSRYAVPFSLPKTSFTFPSTLIEIFFGWCSGFFAIWRVSTPSFNSAPT